jgi:hypothetical protein
MPKRLSFDFIPCQQTYRHFATSASDLPIFLKPFYLDAVCTSDRWSATLAYHGDRIVGALPFFFKKKWVWQYVAMPPLCRFMGPYLLPEHRSVRRQMPLLKALIEQLPSLAAFEQDFHYDANNWLPFYWAGFRQSTRYSYRLRLNDRDILWANVHPRYRNSILPKAADRLSVVQGGDIEHAYRLQKRTYERQGVKVPFTLETLRRLNAALGAEGCRQLFWAVDRRTGEPHAVLYLIWDGQSAYYLFGGGEPALRSSHAGILLIWEAICYAFEVLRLPTFDFLGSMIPSIERVFRLLGGEPRPYFRVQREWSPLWWVGKRLLR